MKTQTRSAKDKEMDCKFCGKENTQRMCAIFSKPTLECPFSMNGGKGMKCLGCWEKDEKALELLKQSAAL